jgi:hypothetical protein
MNTPAEVTVPTELAALAAGVQESTIRKWASRGKLTRYGSPGRAEYALGELSDLAAAAASRPAGSGQFCSGQIYAAAAALARVAQR